MFFTIRQFTTALKSLPTYYRIPGVRWRVVPFAALRAWTYFTEAARYLWTLRRDPPPVYDGEERLTVVLMSYERIANMAPLVAACLQCPFVERVVLSNNNPAYRIARWVRSKDPRLTLIDQPEATRPGIRFDLAREFPADFYLTVDDDLFLSPVQIRDLFVALVDQPTVPHGIFGQCYIGREATLPQLFGWQNNFQREDTSVDVLNRVYALHRQHIERYFAFLEALDIQNSREIGNGEDVIVSQTGDGAPRIHDLGPWFDCILADDPHIALHHVVPDFMRAREELFLDLRRRRAADLHTAREYS